jgi:prepilin-type N-terminal cleavage/methylation domain-containing protein
VTLLEVLVVVAIMSLIAAGVGVASYRHWQGAQLKTAGTNARAVRSAVKSWWVMTGNSGCPTATQLVNDDILDEDSPLTDPWGKPWRIDCSEDHVSVGSDGPDRTPATVDDIRVPPLNRGAGNADPGDAS